MAVKIIAFILPIFLVQAMPQAFAAPTMPLLRGRIEHSDHLTPVEASLRPGVKCDLVKLRQLQPDNFWYQIPDWAAGRFHTEKETTYYRFRYGTRQRDFETDSFTSKGDEIRGWQQDRLGKVWEFAYRDYITTTEHDTAWSVHLVKDCELVEVDQNHMVLRFLGDAIQVSKQTGLITDVEQRESLQTYVPCGDTMVKCDASIKAFDDEGNPVRLSKTLGFELRTGQYKPTSTFRARNMQALFAEFLHTHGYENLIPTNNNYIPLHQAIGTMKQTPTASANYLTGRTTLNDTNSYYTYPLPPASTYGYCCVTPAAASVPSYPISVPIYSRNF